jgi:ankyrin repeat protein
MKISKRALIWLIAAVIVIGGVGAYALSGGSSASRRALLAAMDDEERKIFNASSEEEKKALEEEWFAEGGGSQAQRTAGGGMTVDKWMEICRNGTAEEVKAAIKAGADVNARDYADFTPLMMACHGDTPSLEVIKALLGAGADVNAEDGHGLTALMHAARYEASAEVIKALLDAGADVNAQAKGTLHGRTALIYAETRGSVMGGRLKAEHIEIITLLLDNGADASISTGSYKLPDALHYLSEFTIRGEDRTPEIEALYERVKASVKN